MRPTASSVAREAFLGEMLSLHAVARHASDLIHEGGLALALEATLDEIITTVRGRATLGEAAREAAPAACGAAMQLPQYANGLFDEGLQQGDR